VELSTILEVLRKAQEERRKPEPGEVPGELLVEPSRWRRRRGLWLAIAGIVAVGFAGGWWIGTRHHGAPPPADDAGRVARAGTEARPAAGTPEPVAEAASDPSPPAAAAVPAAPDRAGAAKPEPVRPAARDAEPRTVARKPVAPSPAVAREQREAPPEDLAAAGIGERRPPAYLETPIGPGGPEPPRLRPIQRPRDGTEAPRIALAPPAAVAPAAPPPAPATSSGARGSGSFRDSDDVRIGSSEPPPAAATVPPRAGAAARRDAGGETPSWPETLVDADARLPGVADADGRLPRGGEGASAESPPAVAAAPMPAPAAQPAPSESDALAHAVRRAPYGAPQVTINIVQWSATPARRFAFVRVDGSQMTRVQEGDEVGGLTVRRIFQQAVEFGHGDSSFVLRAN
jgi:hypothetical protein